jgi:dipeptide/tripeptide permease
MLDALQERFHSLAGSPRELWLVYVLKFLESYGYFSLSMLLVLYLSDEFGLSDVEAGVYYGFFGAITGAVGFFIGFIVDSLGVRWGLIFGAAIMTVARLMLAVTHDIRVLKLVLFVLMPIGTSLGIPVMSMGIKRYTTSRNRGFAFGVFYAVMNIAALMSGLLVDLMEIRFNTGMEIFGAHYSPRRVILLSGSVCSLIGLFIAIFVREIKVSESDKVEIVIVETASPWVVLAELGAMPHFWRFMGITVVCINLKMIFRYMDALLPTYLVREFGPHVPKGSISAINPAMIIPLVPVVAALTSDRIHFDMIHVGSYISGMSALPLALFTSIPAAIAFVVILSLGEAIWSPRFYDLTVSMAPEGREGTFVALGAAPLFVAKFPVGVFSGYLLDTYCPKEGPRSSQTMWLIIWGMTMSSPIALSIFQKWLRPPASKEI